MTAHDAAHVFERFFRVDPSRSRARGGHLELDIAPGEGCTFRLVLPGDPSA
ncbi:hypothetical protein [Streptomyces sp. NPDC047043]|uniref:hypothetical protein n=1 Tax=Streptomyces sp. NPDC047043 TaxID=3154497 RepID=UPI0033D8EDC4